MKTGRKVFLFLIVLGAAGAGVYWRYFLKKEEAPEVQIAPVDRLDRLEMIVSATGEIRAKEFVDIQAEIPGVIVDLPVVEGQSVQKGDTLLKIDPFQSRQDMEQARAQYDAALAESGSAEVQIAYAEAGLKQDESALRASESERTQEKLAKDRLQRRFERERELAQRGILSPDEFENTESQLRIAEDRVLVAEARVAQSEARIKATNVSISQMRKQHEASVRRAEGAKAAFDRMNDLLTKTTITSPLTGVITKLNVEKGERAVPGIMSNPQATLMTIADMSVLEAEIRVDETDIVNVALGKKAYVVVDALSDVDIEGFVSEIGNSPILDAGQSLGSTRSNTEGRDFKVVVRLKDPPPQLRPGMSANADIYADHRDRCLVLPLQAITVREVPTDENGRYVAPTLDEIIARELEAEKKKGDAAKNAMPASAPAGGRLAELEGVFVRDGDRARFRPVKLGIKGDSDVEVLDGVQEKDMIVLGPYKTLRTLMDGNRIKVDPLTGVTSVPRAKASARRGHRP